MSFRNLKRDIAETLFSDIIDDAFRDGIHEGRRAAMNNIAFRVRNADIKLTPARREGYEHAITIIDKYKKEFKDFL